MTNNETVFVLRVVKADMTSRRNPDIQGSAPFVWPESGPVEAPDWRDNDECGWGLHGWLWGAGDLTGSCLYWNAEGVKWLVVEVKKDDVRNLNRKIKFPRGNVVFCGARDEAVKYITERAPAGTPVIFGTATAGEGGTATAGYAGTATAGEGGVITLLHWNVDRYKRVIGEIGEEGLKPKTPYILDADGKIVEKK